MRARFFKVIYIVLAVMLTGGCWDALNIEDWEICTAVIVDKTKDGYAFSVEVAAITSVMQNPSSEMGNPKQPMTNIISAHGRTYADAREALDRELNKPVFLGAAQALIMTQRMAEDGIEEYIYRVRELNDYRKTIDIIVTPDDPNEFLNTKPENASAVGFALEYTLQNLYKKGKTFHMSLADLLDKLASKNKCYLTNLMSGRSGQLTLTGYAVFDGPKMIGSIPVDEIRGIVYITSDSTPEFFYTVPTGDMAVTVKATGSGRSISAEYKDGKIHFNLDFQIQGTELYPKKGEVITYEMEGKITRSLEEMIVKDIYDALKTSQEKFKCDYMSLSEAFRIKYPEIYESIDWDSAFQNADFSISADLSLASDKTLDYNPNKQ